MSGRVYYRYLSVEGAKLFTVICLPKEEGKFPVVLYRSPYVDEEQDMTEDAVCTRVAETHSNWLEHGYAVVSQHCRGRGKSSGDCVPYIYEREDGLALQEFVRACPFYNGEIYLCGQSYTASVHFVTAPFEDDIKGAVLEVQDCERYNCNYRNGFYKIGLHGDWYVGMYKKKSLPRKRYVKEAFHMLPLTEFSQTVFGKRAEDFDEILRHPDQSDPFWNTRFGGGEAHDAVKHAHIPILLVTGFYDIYCGGIFDMWHGLDEATKACSALLVHPYDHSGRGDKQPIRFEAGRASEQFGDYRVRWMDSIRGKCEPPVPRGAVTYYRLFENRWSTDAFHGSVRTMTFPLGEGERSYLYNPYAPAAFRGGLSANFGGADWQEPPGRRYDILTFYTPEFEKNVFIKGKMSVKLCVRSDCEDTCFYVRLSLVKREGDFGLRDDINQISNSCAAYIPETELSMEFSFDEHAFLICKGEKLRVDVSSSAYPLYVRHTNQKGLYCTQTTAKVANNTVICDRSELILEIE